MDLFDTLDYHADLNSKVCLNIIVQFLSEDIGWVIRNMSKVDKEIFKELAEHL